MSSNLSLTFQRLKADKRSAFIPFFAAGDPDLQTTADLVKAAAASGADIIELGVPFSDPIADGPVIQGAFHRALEKGFRVGQLFQTVAQLRAGGLRTPLVCMVSYTLVYRQTMQDFCRKCREAGFDALIVPDLPVGYEGDASQRATEAGLDLIFLVAPTTTPERRELICERSRGFIYYMSIAGITGARAALPPDLAAQLALLRQKTATPVCVGFGVSTPQQAAAVAALSDGVIVGSALVKKVEEAQSRGLRGPELVQHVMPLVSDLAAAAHQPH
jgi:tryptophan synthase alpha chain